LGLVAAYNFNEGGGTLLTDVSGKGNNGTIVGGTWTTGKYGGALKFNGSSTYVDLGNPTSLQITGSMSWSAWINAAANPADDGQIIAKSDGSSGWQFKTSPDTGPHTFGAGVSGAIGSSAQRYSTTARALGIWYHVAGVYDAAAQALNIYVNGVLDNGTLRGTAIPASQVNAAVNANIGRRTGGFYFNGIIDEVRMYNRPLSQAEIQTDMNTPISATPNTPPTISDIANQTINEDANTGALAFTVGDAETTAASLSVSGSSSNPTLVPNGNIVFGGSGANRTVTVTPAANQNGTATITVGVSDGQATSSDTFVLTVSAVNDAPTISDIPNQVTSSGVAVGPIAFTIGDIDTPVASLTLSGSSSNQGLVPDGNIVFGGSGATPTVTVTPGAGQTGTATITVTVSDGSLTAVDTFVVTVTAVNTPPTISSIGDQTINEDSGTGALSFTIGDAETAAASLTLGKASSNTGLVPLNNIVFGGSGPDRTVTVTPVANGNGTATITVSVSDGQYTASSSFVLTVTAVNDAPTISSIANQSTSVGTSVGPLNFTVGDPETAAGSLGLSGSSSNTTLVPNGNIVFGGSASNRTVTVTPVAGQSGTTAITLTVSDGALSASSSFTLTVLSGAIGSRSFTNTAKITIPSVGNASPYPSPITVSGMAGSISNVTVTLRGFTHTWPADVDVLLVGPGAQKAVILSDVGGGNALNNITLTLSDSAAAALTTAKIVAGTYKPTNIEPGENGELDSFSAPAPVGPYTSPLSVFGGQTPNGTWSLFVVDDGAGDSGSFATGWSITITTTNAPGSSAVASLVAVPTIPVRASLSRSGDTSVQLMVTATAERDYSVESSSDLQNWEPVGVWHNSTGSFTVLFRDDSQYTGFYRVQDVTPNATSAK
jgi:subtilisin-like proprotein convertase family protein